MLHVPDLDSVSDGIMKRTVEVCQACSATGWIHQEVDDFTTKQVPCDCRRAASFDIGLVAGGIPPEFWSVEQFNFVYNTTNLGVVKKYCDDLTSAKRSGRGFTFLGENGAGKTGMATLILARALRAGFSVGYLTAHDYLSGIPASWRDPALREWLDELTAADFMVLDEMGKEYRAQDASRMADMDGLLRARRSARRPTICISNLGRSEFKDVYGASIDSIMSDINTQLLFEPGDFRKVKRAQV